MDNRKSATTFPDREDLFTHVDFRFWAVLFAKKNENNTLLFSASKGIGSISRYIIQ